jgi:hypothetical protein
MPKVLDASRLKFIFQIHNEALNHHVRIDFIDIVLVYSLHSRLNPHYIFSLSFVKAEKGNIEL